MMLAIFAILRSITGAFPDYVPITTANNLLGIMISTDGFLLGFVGIVFAQLPSSIMDQQNILYQRMLEKHEEASDEMNSLKLLDFRKYGLLLAIAATFSLLLGSIFISMANIADNSKFLPTDTYATFSILFGPLWYTIIAVVLLVFALAVVPLRPPLKKV